MKNFNLVDRVYKNGFVFLYGTPEEIINYADKHSLAFEIEEGQEGFCISTGPDCYIWIRELKLGVLVHECIHATQMAMKHRGVSTDEHNTEITAHHTQWLFEEASEFYLKNFKKNAKKTK